ncbi:hypothetical protein AGMMS49950_05570 [Endomicrobiia bacterium]|nr:hypothetical protein AGMMS49950_05570 [Endomicrobiia bacterium]
MAKKKRYVYKVVHTSSSYPHLRKKNKKAIKFFCRLMSFFVIAFLIYFGGGKLLKVAYKSDKIIIKDIEISGTNNVTKSEIRELLPFNIGDNLLKVNLSEAEEGIKKLKPELKNIVINRRWQKVRVRLCERIPEAFVMCDDGSKVGIDFDGMPFPLRGFMDKMNVPQIICKSADEREQLLKFIKRFRSVCGKFFNNILEIKFSNADDIIFVMKSNTGNITVFWGEAKPELARKFEKFQKVYVDAMAKYKQIECIDMTLSQYGKAIVKPSIGALSLTKKIDANASMDHSKKVGTIVESPTVD